MADVERNTTRRRVSFDSLRTWPSGMHIIPVRNQPVEVCYEGQVSANPR